MEIAKLFFNHNHTFGWSKKSMMVVQELFVVHGRFIHENIKGLMEQSLSML